MHCSKVVLRPLGIEFLNNGCMCRCLPVKGPDVHCWACAEGQHHDAGAPRTAHFRAAPLFHQPGHAQGRDQYPFSCLLLLVCEKRCAQTHLCHLSLTSEFVLLLCPMIVMHKGPVCSSTSTPGCFESGEDNGRPPFLLSWHFHYRSYEKPPVLISKAGLQQAVSLRHCAFCCSGTLTWGAMGIIVRCSSGG